MTAQKGKGQGHLVEHKEYSGTSASNNLKPKNIKTKNQYWKIYEQYVLGNMTMQQLADEHKFSPDHISRMIKYCVTESGDGDKGVYEQSTSDKLMFIMQELDRKMLEVESIPDLSADKKLAMYLKLRQEFRLTLKLQAQARKILSPDIQIGAGAAPQINISVPNLGRGKGIDEAIVVEAEGE